MSALALCTAYSRLQSAERAYVDMLINALQSQADRDGMPLAKIRSIPENIVERDTKGMLQRQAVQFAIMERLTELSRDEDISEARWVREVKAKAYGSLDDILTEGPDGNPVLDYYRAPPEKRRAIKKITFKTSSRRRDSDDPDGIISGMPKEFEVQIEMFDPAPYLKMIQEYANFTGEMVAGKNNAAQTRIAQTDSVETAGERYAAMLEDGQ